MNYKEAISRECENYAKNPKAVFIGYNTKFGSRMYGTLEKVNKNQCIETPVCENLMVGLAIGMSMNGFLPVLCFERHDFMLIALDGIINHMDKLSWLSGDKINLPIVVRAIVGSSTPLDPGVLHKQEYTNELLSMLKHTPVITPVTGYGLELAWKMSGETESGAVVIVEYKDKYLDEIPA